MSDKPQPSETMTVFPVTFTRALASDDGLSVLFEALDGEQKTARFLVSWENLSMLAHMLNQAGVDAAEKRKMAGKSDEFTGVGQVQLVSGFRIREVPERKLKVLSLHSPSGLRTDFALSIEARDANGKAMTQAMAEGLTK
jgi:hypothetical protein